MACRWAHLLLVSIGWQRIDSDPSPLIKAEGPTVQSSQRGDLGRQSYKCLATIRHHSRSMRSRFLTLNVFLGRPGVQNRECSFNVQTEKFAIERSEERR